MFWRHWRVVLTSVLALGVLAWCFMSPSQARPTPEPIEPSAHVETAAAPVAPAKVAQPPRVDSVTTQPAATAEENHIGMQSHPVTPEHQRIYRENNLIGDLNGAMDVGDFAGLRHLLQQYRNEYPEDTHVLQDGYALIADCLERPGPELREKAQRYYDEERASGLRRYIRRHCLEAPSR